MTAEEVWKLYEKHKSLFKTSEADNPFLDGLILLDKLTVSTDYLEKRTNYHIFFSGFYVAALSKMPDIKECDVIELIKLGFVLKKQYPRWPLCFVFFI